MKKPHRTPPLPPGAPISGVHPLLASTQDDWLASQKIRLLMSLRKAGITDTRVLGAMEQVPREQFVEEAFRDRAYEDNALPIAMEQTISMPSVVALMTQALDVKSTQCVLEIGTGSGYQAAVLAKLARRVHTIERHKPLAELARSRFAALKLRNIDSHVGDGSKGWPHAAPYERILVTAAAPEIPQALLAQLTIGGVMVIPVGLHVAEQYLLRLTRTAEDEVSREVLAPVRFVPLVRG
ncbi:MAG: protein-L-isoaspartate(D-aspartate) O-methyltransferase [Alphaproteobacteria bacterium]|nr:protein-L-isoaspartate(D-aspartate) O-methyltransferase [Alphaproteobacteria bacterium]